MRLATLITLVFLSSSVFVSNAATSDAKHYIVYMGLHSHPNSESVVRANHEMLFSVTISSDEVKTSIVHHYSKRGFSAMLTAEQARKLSVNGEVVSVFESRMNELRTTHSWDFLGMNSLQYGDRVPSGSMSDVIVGVIDTGIWPESRSFNDTGLGPVPEKFKGECVPGDNFTLAHCNRKIIGANFYYKGYEARNGPLESFNQTFFRSARDAEGHGTRTTSTIAGSVVDDVSLYGLGRGSRLAMYKAF